MHSHTWEEGGTEGESRRGSERERGGEKQGVIKVFTFDNLIC